MPHRIHSGDWYQPEGLGYTIYTRVIFDSGSVLIVARAHVRDWYFALYDGTSEIIVKGGFPSKFAAMHAVQGMYPVKHPGLSRECRS